MNAATARTWQEVEVETLRLSADMIAAAVAHEDSDAALRDSQQEMAALFNAMRDPVFVIDSNGVYRKVFAHDEDLLARPLNQLIGLNVSEIFDAETAGKFNAVITEVLRDGQLRRLQYPLVLNGEEKWFSASISPMENSVLWVARDITDSHFAREEVRQREELFRLLAENSSDCLATYRPRRHAALRFARRRAHFWLHGAGAERQTQFRAGLSRRCPTS